MRGKLVHKNSRCTGLTLTEVVVASSLLAIAMMPMLKGLTASQVTSTAVERKTQSLILAQAKMEEIRSLCENDYSLSFTERDLLMTGLFYCDISDASSSPDLRVIEISVGYDDDGDGKHDPAEEADAVLTTMMARRE
jgi:Tfp pilus assembly protein PilV